jgi:hypothetical protein
MIMRTNASSMSMLARMAARSAGTSVTGASTATGAQQSRSMSANAKVWIDKDTRVICQGFTGKQVRYLTLLMLWLSRSYYFTLRDPSQHSIPLDSTRLDSTRSNLFIEFFAIFFLHSHYVRTYIYLSIYLSSNTILYYTIGNIPFDTSD